MSHERLSKVVKQLGWEYSLDAEGDYRIQVPLESGGTHTVGISSHATILEGEFAVRDVWAVAARIPGELPDGLAENLMSDSWGTRSWGTWALAGITSDGKRVLVRLGRIPVDAEKKMMASVLLETARTAYQMQNALSAIDASGEQE
ncbi:MAG: hypothetical protein MI717_01110 [Spirochaetales bacterium]|nr:hypothetical protein [Spirochaetales bacterium]